MNIKERLNTEEYGFLKNNGHLGRHLILLGLSGSYSYGTNQENSDIDIRGVALNQKSDLIGLTAFEQYVDDHTDTCIYSFQKIIRLLLECNPNTIELLGLKKEHYLYLHPIGRKLLENKSLFLSKRAVRSFGGYADAQLRRLQNALARDSLPQREKEQHIYNSIRNAMYDFAGRYTRFEEGAVRLYLAPSERPEYEREIYADIHLSHYPLRDYKNMWAEMNNIVRDYNKIGKRNKKKDNDHLNKHAMHLIRLFMMAIDILEKGEIITWRAEEQTLLRQIREGAFQKEDGAFREEFYSLLASYEKKLHLAAEHTRLPEEPDWKAVERFVMRVNERVVRDEI